MPIPTPTLTVADKQDGTGVTVMISGSDVGATNEVFSHSLAEAFDQTLNWVLRATIVGNGSTNVAITLGSYWWKAESMLGLELRTSEVAYAGATDDDEALHWRIFQECRNIILTLALPGLSSDRVYLRPIMTPENLRFPCVVISLGQSKSEVGGTNARDDVGYQVAVMAADRISPEDPDDRIKLRLLWRERLERAFRHKTLAVLKDVVYIARIEHLSLLDDRLPEWLTYLSGVNVTFAARQSRS